MSDVIRQGILNLAAKIGADPADLATVISYETGGTFDPNKVGPTTKWGQHKGLFQWGEPQAKKYGVDWKNPMSQFEAAAQYFTDAGYKPGMGLLDLYSAVNAGKVGKYNASDTAAGGAPGTVADKVRNQMSGHMDKAKTLLGLGDSNYQYPATQPNLGPTQGLGSNQSPEAAFVVPDQPSSFSPSQGPGEAETAGVLDYLKANKDAFSGFGEAFASQEPQQAQTGPIIAKRAEYQYRPSQPQQDQYDPIGILRQLGLI